jgi:hypothetical protein
MLLFGASFEGRNTTLFLTQGVPAAHRVSDFIHSINSFIHPSIPLACAECDDSLPSSGVSPIPLCYVPFPSTPLHQPDFHPPPLPPCYIFLGRPLSLVVSKSYIILFWEFYFLPFSVHAQTNIIYLTLLSLL